MAKKREDLQLSGEMRGMALFGTRNVVFQGFISVLRLAMMRPLQRHERNCECSLGWLKMAHDLKPCTGPAARPPWLSSLQ